MTGLKRDRYLYLVFGTLGINEVLVHECVEIILRAREKQCYCTQYIIVVVTWISNLITQPAITCSKLIIQTSDLGVKYVQS